MTTLAKNKIYDLPTDVLYTIFPYLLPADFLRFTCSNKYLYAYSQDPYYWRILTKKTFRFSASPLLQASGTQWKRLYRRLFTQTRLYTWGNDDRGCLGLPEKGSASSQTQFGNRTVRAGQRHLQPRYSGYPMRPDLSAEPVGIVTDVQCGGWSTTLLNSYGVLYFLGNFDGQTFAEAYDTRLKRLGFPPNVSPTTSARYDPSTAIQHFSTGRNHVLGLSDDRRIWMWTEKQGIEIVLALVGEMQTRRVRVVAGWDLCSAYVEGNGIVFWKPNTEKRTESSQVLHTHFATVPNTGDLVRRGQTSSNAIAESWSGEVHHHIVLEGYIVFTTSTNKLFAHSTASSHPEDLQPAPVELSTFYQSQSPNEFEIRDLQGSFRSFAIFTASGEVLTGTRSLIDAFFHESTAPKPPPTLIPSLQNQSVISLAFGDYHIHALHSNGTISSFGSDPNGIGAFGLGRLPLCGLRGVRAGTNTHDTKLSGEKRRTIWFEPLMQTWLQYSLHQIYQRLRRPTDRGNNLDPRSLEPYADYFEEQGSRWEDGVSEDGEETEQLPAYFALKVSAAGWHSAALVLVDEDKAERARQKHIIPSIPVVETHLASGQPGQDMEQGPISTGAAWMSAFLYWLVRWFLGLTARDARAAEVAKAEEREREDQEERRDRVRYVWEEQVIPQLPAPAP